MCVCVEILNYFADQISKINQSIIIYKYAMVKKNSISGYLSRGLYVHDLLLDFIGRNVFVLRVGHIFSPSLAWKKKSVFIFFRAITKPKCLWLTADRFCCTDNLWMDGKRTAGNVSYIPYRNNWFNTHPPQYIVSYPFPLTLLSLIFVAQKIHNDYINLYFVLWCDAYKVKIK